MLSLPGFRILEVEESAAGVIIRIETSADDASCSALFGSGLPPLLLAAGPVGNRCRGEVRFRPD